MDSSSWKAAERGQESRSDRAGPPDGATAARPFVSPASQAEHARVGKRLLWALPGALLLLGLLFWLGPSAETVERQLAFYGKDGPLHIMPEIAVEDGSHQAHQRARAPSSPPAGAPHYEVEPENPRSLDKTPPPRQGEAPALLAAPNEAREPINEMVANVTSDGDAYVDMQLPSQFSESDYIILKLVRPLPPPYTGAADRHRPFIVVQAGIYLDQEANIVGVVIESNDGGPEYADVVRHAMQQWELEPRWRDGKPPAPRWLRVIWRFRNPFAES